MRTACRERLPTINLLQKKGMFLTNMGPLCKQDGESTNHLLIHYLFAREVWEEVLKEVRVAWVFPSSNSELFQC